MLYVNVLFITLVAFALGYIFGKGKIEIVKRVAPTKEQQEEIERWQKETKEVIEAYNEAMQSITNI